MEGNIAEHLDIQWVTALDGIPASDLKETLDELARAPIPMTFTPISLGANVCRCSAVQPRKAQELDPATGSWHGSSRSACGGRASSANPSLADFNRDFDSGECAIQCQRMCPKVHNTRHNLRTPELRQPHLFPLTEAVVPIESVGQ